MNDLALIAVLGVAAFLVAWVVNGLVGMMSGENPRDTGRLGAEVFLRLFAVLELGFIGRMLNYLGVTSWPRRLMLFVGLLCLLVFLTRAWHEAQTDDRRFDRTYVITNGEPYEIKQH